MIRRINYLQDTSFLASQLLFIVTKIVIHISLIITRYYEDHYNIIPQGHFLSELNAFMYLHCNYARC